MVTHMTADTPMLRVHVAAVGFEVDRIAMPAVRMKADRVWLIAHSMPSEDKGTTFREDIIHALKKEKIEYRIVTANRTDLFDTLRALSSIITQEKNNALYVNVSVGSKIQSIAAMMACMMFKDRKIMIKPYYAVPGQYVIEPKEQETIGVQEIIDLPEYKIETPNDNLIKCMDIIWQSGNRISKKALKDKAISSGLIRVEGKEGREPSEQAPYMALNKNLLEPLDGWGFVTVDKVGSRYMVQLTSEGEHALKFLKVRIS
jgi:hypothetical protein